MEIKKKQKTLAGLFLKFTVIFCLNIVVIITICLLLLIGSSYLGMTLPSNYAEKQLEEHTKKIRSAGEAVEKWIPKGCTFGVYDSEGRWICGNFSKKEREKAWLQYKKGNIYVSAKSCYRFIRQDDGNICIVQYDLYMKYSCDALNDILPGPERMSFILDILFFVLNAVFLSRYFAKRLNCQLRELSIITDKIAQNDLEFETKPSYIKEIDEVMTSFSQMKDALSESLTVQWDLEHQKQEQLAALAHDIKTPLTIIKGNAELLAEDDLSLENKECTKYIVSNVRDIEQYLDRIKQVLYGNNQEHDFEVVSCIRLEEMFREAAIQMAAAEKMPVVFDTNELEGQVHCNPENVLRAWKNVLSNATEYTDRERGIKVHFRQCREESQCYMVASVHDYGAGFSAKDLVNADKEFYSGDASRHNRKHQGLGLAIAKRFMEEQGGQIKFFNNKDNGAEVECWIKVDN